jgi:7-carboxy-7-deazaguanine synthase
MPVNILIAELFGPVLQGEGAMCGKVSHFVRTAGCGYRCSWCDSMHAVDPVNIAQTAKRLTADQIVGAVYLLPTAPWVTLTGGDPVAWDLSDVVTQLHRTHKLAVETQGQLWHDWLDYVDLVTCSPKAPSSGMADQLDMAMLRKYQVRLQGKLVFKIVCFGEVDLDFAERIHMRFPEIPFYITTGTPVDHSVALVSVREKVLDGFRQVSEMVLKRPKLLDAVIGCQQHALLYGRELGR